MKHTNAERFCRVAEERVNRAIHDLEKTGDCSDTRYYEYTDAQVEQIVKALREAVDDAEHRLRTRGKSRRFRLEDVLDDQR